MVLQRATRKELLRLIGALQQGNASLRAQVRQLSQRIQELESQLEGLHARKTPAPVKPNVPKAPKGPRKARRRNYARRRARAVDEVRHHAAEVCPDCGRRLHGGWTHRSREVIDIPPVRVRVTRHVIVARRCGGCGKRCLPTLGPEQLGARGQRRFGVNLQSLVAALHAANRMPLGQIRELMRELFGLHISAGELVELLDGVAEAGRGQLRQIQAGVQGSDVVNADETGWREDGRNGYVWTFATPTLRHFVYRHSRGGQVVSEALGEQFAGTCVSDFYGAYNVLSGPHQRCWSHLGRDGHALKEEHADSLEVVGWVDSLHALYEAGCKWREHPDEKVRFEAQRHLESRVLQLAGPYVSDKSAPQHKLAKRIDRFVDELFTYVGDPKVPPDNNAAERSLRHTVIARKVSGGTRSPKGSATRMALSSLFGTWTAQGRELLPTCRELLLSPATP